MLLARPQKVGLDYFPLDVDIDQDDKVAIIEAQHGTIGFSIVIKLLMKIYSEGYYYDWTEKEQILFSKRVNADINQVNVIINDCIKWGLFDAEVFNVYKILTSKGIQLRYFEAVKRRQRVEIAKEFLLLDDGTVKNYTNLVIVSINEDEEDIQEVNVDINQEGEEVNVDINPQSKVKESKVNKSILKQKEKQEKEKVVVVNDKSLDGRDSKDDDSDRDGRDSTISDSLHDLDLQRISTAFEQNGFGTINITVKEMILDYMELYSTEWILAAMKIAVESNKRSLRYVRGILENWNRSGGMQLSNVQQDKPKTVPIRKTKFHNFDQRTDQYTGDEINKRVEDIAKRKRRETREKMNQEGVL